MTLSGVRNLKDRAAAVALSALVALFAYFCSTGEPPAGLWEELTIAAGIHPASVTNHSLWLRLATALFEATSMDFGYRMLRLAGPVSMGVLAYFFGGLLQMLLPEFLRRQLAETRSRALLRRCLVLPVTLLFAISEPVWRLGHFFGPETLHFLLGFFAFVCFVRYFRLQRRRYVILAYGLLGLLSAEEIFGFVELAVFSVALAHRGFLLRNSTAVTAKSDTTAFVFLQRVLAIVFTIALGGGIYLAGEYFFEHGGFDCLEGDGAAAIIEFVKEYLRGISAAATKGGWVYCCGMGPALVLVALLKIRDSIDVEKMLTYRMTLLYLAAGFIAFLQLAHFPIFWLWQSDAGRDLVSSPFMLAWISVSSALTLSASLLVLMVEVYFRRYDRLAGAIFHGAGEDIVKKFESRRRRVFRWLWLVPLVITYAIVMLSLWWCPKPGERGMYAALREFVDLAADEAEGSPIAITEGFSDAALEFEMRRRGVADFKTLSVLSDATPRNRYLRRRGEAEKSEDWIALGISVPATLREWVRGGSARATNLTVQIAFEFWRRERLPVPSPGATAARTDGYAPAKRAEIVARGRRLGIRMCELAERGAPFVTSDGDLREFWNFALGRLARIARLRADEAEAAGYTVRAKDDAELADMLDDANPAYQKVREQLEWVPRQVYAKLTPREGLRFALHQADFVMASTYARQILARNEDDFAANFAMGMYYVSASQNQRALRHLEKAVKTNPREPAALNNLATVEMYLGRLERALEHAEAAIKLAPNIPEIKETYSRVKRELAKREGGN